MYCISLCLLEFEWRLGEWSTCSASCGNRGTQMRKVRCLTSEGQEMPHSICHHLPKPISQPQPCNLLDCPPRYTIIQILKETSYPEMMKRYSPSHHPRYRGICSFIGTDLENLSITSLAHRLILCSEWVPSEWESKHLIKSNPQSSSASINIFFILLFQHWTITSGQNTSP